MTVRTSPTAIPSDELQEFADAYQDAPEAHAALYRAFDDGANSIPAVRKHRDYVEANEHGYGDRAFHYMWKLLVDRMPDRFRFLEIGVYKGQHVSLMRLLAQLAGKDATIFGVTPLSTDGDRFSDYEDCDYLDAITRIHRDLAIPTDRLTLIRGFSQTEESIVHARRNAPYDLLYVDGCHELEAVLGDLAIYPQMVRPGGYVVVDDASYYLNLPGGLFRGWPDVSIAVERVLGADPAFGHLFACGHNRVWQRR